MPDTLQTALTALARRSGPDLAWFADRMDGLAAAPAARPNLHPVVPTIADRTPPGTALTQPVIDALLSCADALPWTQSCTTEDSGFDQHYLDNYAFLNLVSPIGLYVSDDIRVTLGFWGEGLACPTHAHAPEEWYVMLAGSCVLHSESRAPRPCGPGDVVHHAPWQKHRAEFTPGPLLAAAFWRGAGLMNKYTFYPEAP